MRSYTLIIGMLLALSVSSVYAGEASCKSCNGTGKIVVDCPKCKVKITGNPRTAERIANMRRHVKEMERSVKLNFKSAQDYEDTGVRASFVAKYRKQARSIQAQIPAARARLAALENAANKGVKIDKMKLLRDRVANAEKILSAAKEDLAKAEKADEKDKSKDF